MVENFHVNNVYKIRMDTVSDSDYSYYGYAQYGAAPDEPKWRIQRVAKADSGQDVEVVAWTGPPDDFSKKWTERTTYVYN